MANSNQTDVELRIRATDYSRKTTDQVVDSLKELTKAQDAQLEAAKKGSAGAADLEKSYTRIESAVKALLGQQAIIKLFQQQAGALADLNTKLEAARKAQADYAASLDPNVKRTAAQERELRKLSKAAADVEKQIARTEAKMATRASQLDALGISSSNLAAKQQQIVSAVTAANSALERQEQAINSVDAQNAARKAAADAIAQRELQIKVDNTFSAAERQLAAAHEAEAAAQRNATRAARERAEADAMTDAQRDADLEALFTREANKRTAAINAQRAAMLAAADAAERMARSSSTTARGTSPVQGNQFSNIIRDIQNPTQAAVQTVGGLETAITSLQERVSAIRGPVRQYAATLRDAQAAQAALTSIAGQIDTYNRQIAAVRAARQEYVAARTAVNALVAEMRSGAAGDDVTTRLARAQTTLRGAAQELGNVTTAARGTRSALNAAGIDTSRMAQAEAQLVQQADRATTAMNQLTQAYQRNGAASERTRTGFLSWFGGDGGRTTLSYTQRLRGELLAMTTAFVGLNAAIELGRKTLAAYSTNQAILSRLTIANGGDARKAADDFKYLQEQADRIGFVFNDIAPAYTKFAIAMKAAGFTTEQTRFSFENIAGSAVKAKLSTQELEGILKAFEQIASKGTVQAEELRGQLGDRLPGAFQIAAKAAGKTVEEYTKMMELGQVGSEQVIAIARELGKTYGAAEGGAATLLQAQARFENAQNRFLTKTGEGGFVEAYQAFITRLTKLLDDGSLDKFATLLSKGLVGAIDVLDTVARNFDLLKIAIEGVIALRLLAWLTSLPGLFKAVSAQVVILNGWLLAAEARLGAVGAAAAIAGAGASGFTGFLLRMAPALIAVGNALLFVARSIPVLGAGLIAYQATTAILDRLDDGVRDRVKKAFKETEKATAAAQQAQQAIANASNDKERKAAQEHYDKMRAAAVAAINKQNAAVEEAKRKNVDLSGIQDELTAPDLNAPKGTPDPGNPDTGPKALAKLQADLAKEAKITERKMQNERLRAAKGDLAARLDLIDQEFDERRDQAQKTFKDEKQLAAAMDAINKASLEKQNLERAKYANEQKKQGESVAKQRVTLAADIASELERIEDDIKKRAAEQDVTEPFETRRKARIEAIGHAYDELEKKIRRQANLDPKAAAASQKQLDDLTKQRQQLEDVTAKREEAVRLQSEFNKLQDIQKTKLDEINSRYESGQGDLASRTAELNKVIADTGPGIEAAGKRALEFAESVKAMLDPLAYQKLVANVNSGLASSNVAAATSANNMALSQQQLNDALAGQAAEIERINTMRSLGMITSEQQADMLNANADAYKQRLLDILTLMRQQLETARQLGTITPEAYVKQSAAIDQSELSVRNAIAAHSELNTVIANSIATNAVNAFDTLGQEIAKVAVGAQSIGEGFRGALVAVAQFFAQLLRDIALAIAKQLILNAISGFGGPVGAAATAAGGVAKAAGNHSGGVVGRTRSFTRTVDPAMFAGAQRFHNGGLPGLRADEVPTILQKGEEVLTKGDPRNVLNGGRATGGEGGVDAGTRVVVVDDRQSVPEAMNSSSGERVIMAHIKNNLPTIKSLLRS